MRSCVIYLLAAVCFACAPSALGNVVGSVRGVVHDPQHRPIADANVHLQAADSSWAQSARSNADGEFVFATVPVGIYIITVSAPNFETASQRIEVTANSSPVVHFPLELSSVTQTATVKAPSELANPQSATPTSLVSSATINQTPGADRTNSLQMITNFVPGAYMTHDMLHVRGGHQVSWLIDGVPIPNTNIASNVGPQVDPKDIDYLDVQRGSYNAAYGDRTYGVFDVIPKNGFNMNNEGELALSFGDFYQTDDYLSFGGHSETLAYYASLDGNRSNLGLETPVAQIRHDAENGFGGFGSLMYNAGTSDQFRMVGSLRRDYYQIPYDPNPNDFENSQFDTSGLRDNQEEGDRYALVSWIHTFTPNIVMTVSPFYHYNSANYRGAPNDTPIATTDLRASNYAGGQASIALTLPHNDAEIGAYSFFQQDNQTFSLTFNPPTQAPVYSAPSVSGALESAFLSDKFTLASWLTFTGGMRYTHFSGGTTAGATDPRIGAALHIPHLNWVLRAFYGRYYQPPPLASIAGPLLQFCQANNCSFVALPGERDEEHQFGLTIPVHGWALDFDTFETRSQNYFDHNNIGESEVFSPVTIAEARIRGNELTLTSPNLWNRAQIHLAYSNQIAQAKGAITGGLVCFNPSDPAACAFSNVYEPLDHDQRNTLNVGFHVAFPWHTHFSSNLYYGSGFTNGEAGVAGSPYQEPYLPGHTTVDISAGKDFGEKYSVSVTALNIADSHLLIDNSLTFGGFHYNNPREVYAQFRYRFHF
jgi:hypothetical protein